MDVLEAIKTRRSIGRMMADEPPREVIEQLIEAAIEAPNHHNTEPWRFFVLSGKAREEFGEVLARSLRARWRGDDSKIDGFLIAERAKPLRSPVLIVVGVKNANNERIDPREDLQAASAAIQNILLAAHARGLSSVWRTGEGVYDANVKAYFNLEPQDEIAGIVYLGYADPEARAGTPARQRSAITEWRNGSAG